MNRCDEYLENLSAYLDSELPENSIKDIEEHLNKCEKCSEELSILKTIVSALNELEEELPDGFETSLHKRLEEAGTKSGVKIRFGKVRLFAQIAAGFVIVLCLGFAIRAGLMRTGGKTAAPAADMATAGAAMQKTDEGGFGTVNGIMSARSMITEDARIPEEASDSAEPEMKYFATDDSAEDKEIASVSMADIQKAQADEDVMIAFSDTSSYALKKDGQDTLVKITADDAQIVLKKIIEIDTVINQEVHYSNIAGLNKALDAVNTETYGGNQIEVKLLYLNDETWNEFLTKMQVVFPEVYIESAPKTEDIEYIRIEIIEE
jgi:mRNA-degrading endonuclease RelE of RelBE toxin-antitoxin system